MNAISPRPRHKSGKLKQPTKAEREAAQRAREDAERLTVLAQPHRRGSIDQKCTSALGRFVIHHKLREELFLAGEEYASLIRRWRLTVASIRVEGHKSLGGSPREATREEVNRLTNRVSAADDVLWRVGAYRWLRLIAIDHPTEDIKQIPDDARQCIIDGLFSLAYHFGMLPPGKR